VGRDKLFLRELEFGQLNAVTIIEEGHKIGTVFITTEYQPINTQLLHPDWVKNLKEASQLEDKFEFFNDFLTNEFKDQVQFGYLTV